MEGQRGKRLIGEIYALLAAFTWACALVLFKRGGEHLSPMGLNLFKNLVSLSLLSATLIFYGGFFTTFQLLSLQECLLLCLSGILGIAVADSFLFASLQRIGVTRITIIDCLYSPSVLFFSWLFLSEDIGWIHLYGLILIVSGILLSTLGRKEPGSATLQISRKDLVLGTIYGILAIVFMAVGIVMVKPILERLPILWSTTIRLLAGAVTLFIWIGFAEPPSLKQLIRPNPSWKFVIPGAFLGSYVSMLFWIGGFKHAQASIAGLLNQSTVVFAIPLSILFLKESVSYSKVGAVVLAASGVLLVALRPF